MDENIKDILSTIDEIIASGEEPSDEVLELLEEILAEISSTKEKRKEKTSLELVQRLDELIGKTSNNENITRETAQNIITAIEKIKIETPVPLVNVSPPEVRVEVPKIDMPRVVIPPQEPPIVNMPDMVSVRRPSWIDKIVSLTGIEKLLKEIKNAIPSVKWPKSAKEAISVRLSDGEKFYKAIGGGLSTLGNLLTFANSDNEKKAALVDGDRHVQVDILTSGLPTGAATEAKQDDVIDELQTINSFTPSVYDYISLAYTDGNLVTVVFKNGGSGGTTVSTLTLAYTDGNLVSVTKT